MPDPTLAVSYVVTIMPDDAAAAVGLRKPEIWQAQGLDRLMRDALPPGNSSDKSPSTASYVTVNVPAPVVEPSVRQL